MIIQTFMYSYHYGYNIPAGTLTVPLLVCMVTPDPLQLRHGVVTI